jgi:hypothetical protein
MGIVYSMIEADSDLTAVRNAIRRQGAYLGGFRRFVR